MDRPNQVELGTLAVGDRFIWTLRKRAKHLDDPLIPIRRYTYTQHTGTVLELANKIDFVRVHWDIDTQPGLAAITYLHISDLVVLLED